MRTTIDRGDHADNEGPHHHQEVRGEHIDNVWVTSNLFEDVESVTLHDVCYVRG
jgi:hypothetical protein